MGRQRRHGRARYQRLTGGQIFILGTRYLRASVADPVRDPVPFRSLDPGWVKNQDPYPGSGMNIPDHISESLKQFFGLKILKFFDADPDLGSGIRNLFDTGSGIQDGKIRIRDKHPGSATQRK
jgi:hypothetical protein